MRKPIFVPAWFGRFNLQIANSISSQLMPFLRNKFLPIALLLIFAIALITPHAATFLPLQVDSCGMGCAGV
ncbi:MAG: hypothetical protein ACRENG_18380, partial [bacterium]